MDTSTLSTRMALAVLFAVLTTISQEADTDISPEIGFLESEELATTNVKSKDKDVVRANHPQDEWRRKYRRNVLERMTKADKRDYEVREKSDERSRKQQRKEQEQDCKIRIRNMKAWKKHKEIAATKGKKATKVWTVGQRVFDVVKLKTHADKNGLINRKVPIKRPDEDACGCKLGVEGYKSHNKHGPPRCKKGATTNRFEAEHCIEEAKYCKPLRKYDACACKLNSEGYSSTKHRCMRGSITNFKEAAFCLAHKTKKKKKKKKKRNQEM